MAAPESSGTQASSNYSTVLGNSGSKIAVPAPALMFKFQQAERRQREGLMLSLFWETSQNYHPIFCLNLIGQNLVTWSHLAAEEPGKCSPWLGGQLKLGGLYY